MYILILDGNVNSRDDIERTDSLEILIEGNLFETWFTISIARITKLFRHRFSKILFLVNLWVKNTTDLG